jgi:hypothetical protein
VRGFGAWWEKKRRVLTVEIVDILVGVGRDDGFWCLSGHGEEELVWCCLYRPWHSRSHVMIAYTPFPKFVPRYSTLNRFEQTIPDNYSPVNESFYSTIRIRLRVPQQRSNVGQHGNIISG